MLADLYVECFQEGRDLPDVAADVVILAGDIHRETKGLFWAAERFSGHKFVYVPGNHEFYRTSMPDLRPALRAEAERAVLRPTSGDQPSCALTEMYSAKI